MSLVSTDADQPLSLEQIERDAQPRRPGLTFHLEVEALYRREAVSSTHRVVAINWLIGISLFDMFLLSDYVSDAGEFGIYLVGRILVITPIVLLLLRNILTNRHYALSLCLVPIVFSAGLAILIVVTDGPYRSNYLFGLILLMICGYVISRPRLIHAVITVLVQAAIYEVAMRWSRLMTPEGEVVSTLFCISGAVVTIMTAYALESVSRRAFILSLRVRLMNQQLEGMATTDPLTGLGNRNAFEIATRSFWDKSKDLPAVASLILVDVDHFKQFNDNYGHAAGDSSLKQIGGAVRDLLRHGTAIRFGGEEIVVFLPDTDFAAACSIAEQIRLAIRNSGIPHPAMGPDAVVTASLGVAAALTTQCSPEELVARADVALYAAKRNGRDQVWPPLDASLPRAGGHDVRSTAAERSAEPTVAASSKSSAHQHDALLAHAALSA